MGLGGDSDSVKRYCQTKLANTLFTNALVDKLGAAGLSKIKAVVAAPGLAATAIYDNAEFPILPWFIPNCLIQSTEDGTMPLLVCMAGTEGRTGDFYLPLSGLCGALFSEAYGPVRTIRAPWPNSEQNSTDPKSQ